MCMNLAYGRTKEKGMEPNLIFFVLKKLNIKNVRVPFWDRIYFLFASILFLHGYPHFLNVKNSARQDSYS
jgi:hypothetical protein